jgi:hypothetical protein
MEIPELGFYEDFEGFFPPANFVVVAEYDEEFCVPSGTFLEPGEEMTITFDQWIPDALAIGDSGSFDYEVTACTLLLGDENPVNDCKNLGITLDFWHDVKVVDVGLPTDGRDDPIFEQLPTDPAGSWSFYTSAAGGPHICHEDFFGLTSTIGGMNFWGLCLIFAGGWTPGDPNTLPFEIKFYEDSGGAPGAEVFSISDVYPTVEDTGQTYSGFAMYHFKDISLSGVPNLETGWFSIQSQDAPDGAWVLLANSPDGNLNAMQNGASLADNIAIQLYGGGGGGPGAADKFAQPGMYAPFADLENLGTFPESGLTAFAEIYEYISDPNGTLVWTDSVTDIAMDPLGGTATASYMDYDFALEGLYTITVNMPLATDDSAGNNIKTITIGIDDTAPTSTHALDPPAPTGANGWYVSDVTVTITGNDGTEPFQSGVDHFEYRIDGGAWQTGDTFVISSNGQHTIDYKAVDGVGNEEAPNSFDIDMDQDGPTVDLTWEAVGGLSQDIIFTATCSDADSGMDYVEFYFNDVLQFTDDAEPYQWIMTYAPGTKFTVKAIAYDLAGNTDFDELTSGEGLSVNVNSVTPLVK